MHSKIICIYCICDDFLSAFGLKDDKQCRMTSAEVLIVAIISAIFFNGNLARARFVLKGFLLKLVIFIVSFSIEQVL